jgi:hypothetical protein
MLNMFVGTFLLYFIAMFFVFVIPDKYHSMLLGIATSYIVMDIVSKFWSKNEPR